MRINKTLEKYFPFTVALSLHILVFVIFFVSNKHREEILNSIGVEKSQNKANLISINLNSIKNETLNQNKHSPNSTQKKIPNNSLNTKNNNSILGITTNQVYDDPQEKNPEKANEIIDGDKSEGPKGYFPNPEYPKLARIKGIEGEVKLQIQFNQNGTVASVKIIQSSQNILLDESAIKAVQKWTIQANAPLEMVKTIIFKLK